MVINIATVAILASLVIGISQTIKMWFKNLLWWKKIYGYAIVGITSIGVVLWHIFTAVKVFDFWYFVAMFLLVFAEASGVYKFIKK